MAVTYRYEHLSAERKEFVKIGSDVNALVKTVKEIVDEAIKHANRKTVGHFFDIIVAKRYDDEDMIIIKEKDFR